MLGAKLNKSGNKVSGTAMSLFLEEVALKLMLHLIEKEKYACLVINERKGTNEFACSISIKLFSGRNQFDRLYKT